MIFLEFHVTVDLERLRAFRKRPSFVQVLPLRQYRLLSLLVGIVNGSRAFSIRTIFMIMPVQG